MALCLTRPIGGQEDQRPVFISIKYIANDGDYDSKYFVAGNFVSCYKELYKQ